MVIGELSRVEENAVETAAGMRIAADVLIKCTGFTQDVAFDKAIDHDIKRGGRVACFHHSNARRTYDSTRSVTRFVGGSGGQRHHAPCLAFFAMVEQSPASELAEHTNALRARVATRSRSRQSWEHFLDEQQREWAQFGELLGVRIDYPYTVRDFEELESLVRSAVVRSTSQGGIELN